MYKNVHVEECSCCIDKEMVGKIYVLQFFLQNIYKKININILICSFKEVKIFISKRLPRYNWNIVESGIKHHNPLIRQRVKNDILRKKRFLLIKVGEGRVDQKQTLS